MISRFGLAYAHGGVIMAKKQKQNDAQITVRVPSELRVDLEAIAKKQGRSLSNLVIHILKSYVENN